MFTYKFSIFFNLVQKNSLTVKKFSKCRENGIVCLRKGKLRRLHDTSCCHATTVVPNTAGSPNSLKWDYDRKTAVNHDESIYRVSVSPDFDSWLTLFVILQAALYALEDGGMSV